MRDKLTALICGLNFEATCAWMSRLFNLRHEPGRLPQSKIGLGCEDRSWNAYSKWRKAHLDTRGRGEVLNETRFKFVVVRGTGKQIFNDLAGHWPRSKSDAMGWHHNALTENGIPT